MQHADLHGDKLREECGVFGVLGPQDSAELTALGLHALQHRGQEAAGIVSYDGTQFHSERHMGLVGDNFADGSDTIERLPGRAAMGHVRYSTTGETVLRNVQPLFAELGTGGIAIAHNGNFTNALSLRRDLIKKGAICQSTSDTEVVLHLVARSQKQNSADRFEDAIRQMQGAYSLIALTTTKLIGARDPLGIRPLVLGYLDEHPILASETCALDIVGATYARDIEPGEIIIFEFEQDGSVSEKSRKPKNPPSARPCVFEYVYFSRPDSVVNGRSVYEVRKKLGQRLAQETHVDADVVVPVPDSGVPAAVGYAQQAGLAFELGIIRNHYVGRTFIQPAQSIRDIGVRMKHSANKAQVSGKNVILIDDSIVRGTTSIKIVEMMRNAGARQVHMRVACPKIIASDYYGIDTPDKSKLLANRYETTQQMCDYIGADSLDFLSIDGLYQAILGEPRNDLVPQFSDHCFTNDYPTALTDQTQSSKRAERERTMLRVLS